MTHPQNPAIPKIIEWLYSSARVSFPCSICDLGCGRLRHFSVFESLATNLILVDTAHQLQRLHRDGEATYTIPQFAAQKSRKGKAIATETFDDFGKSRHQLDIIFCIAVFDVVPREIRKQITRAARLNLKAGGRFVIVAPRNDTSITRRCTEQNRYKDGHVFHHHGLTTFFKNFSTCTTIINDCDDQSLTLEKDLSRYRQATLVFRC